MTSQPADTTEPTQDAEPRLTTLVFYVSSPLCAMPQTRTTEMDDAVRFMFGRFDGFKSHKVWFNAAGIELTFDDSKTPRLAVSDAVSQALYDLSRLKRLPGCSI